MKCGLTIIGPSGSGKSTFFGLNLLEEVTKVKLQLMDMI